MGKKKKSFPELPVKEFRTGVFAALKGVKACADKPVADKASDVKQFFEPMGDDSALFLSAMAGVSPIDLSVRNKAVAMGSTKKTTQKQLSTVSVIAVESSPVFMDEIRRLKLEKTFKHEQVSEDEIKPLSGDRFRQLKRGIVTVGSQLDLHGLYKDEAIAELQRFLVSAQLRGEKAVLIITGKGINSVAEPVLNQAVASWLRTSSRHLISEFAPAPREMGGSGAFVVFMKRLKASV